MEFLDILVNFFIDAVMVFYGTVVMMIGELSSFIFLRNWNFKIKYCISLIYQSESESRCFNNVPAISLSWLSTFTFRIQTAVDTQLSLKIRSFV